MIITVTNPIMYGLENILLEKPEKIFNSIDCSTLLVSCWLALGNLALEKSYSFKERRDVTIGICVKKKIYLYI